MKILMGIFIWALIVSGSFFTPKIHLSEQDGTQNCVYFENHTSGLNLTAEIFNFHRSGHVEQINNLKTGYLLKGNDRFVRSADIHIRMTDNDSSYSPISNSQTITACSSTCSLIKDIKNLVLKCKNKEKSYEEDLEL